MSTTATESKFAQPGGARRDGRIILGVDEAGYGPNLGPMIIAGTAWRVPDHVGESEFTKLMAERFCTKVWAAECSHVPLGDSKQLYSPSSGLRTLEAGLLAMLAQLPNQPEYPTTSDINRSDSMLALLLDRLACDMPPAAPPAPSTAWRDFAWYRCLPKAVPEHLPDREIERLSEIASGCLASLGIELLAVKALVVDESYYNQSVAKLGSKGRLLSQLTMHLVCQLMAPWSEHEIEVFCDRQGGRKKYSCVLLEAMPDDWFDTLQELDARSSYRRQRAPKLQVHFSVGGDSFPPTALASMTAKYLRERLMSSINHYWAGHVAELKPTAGYPNDARRYRDQIAPAAQRLGHDVQDWWRVC